MPAGAPLPFAGRRRRAPGDEARDRFFADVRARHPGFARAVAADARIAARHQGLPERRGGRWDTALLALRLCWTADAFAALVAYRARCALARRGVPVLPRLLHRWSMATAQVCIGDPVHVDPGVYLAHGQVVIDGIVEVGADVVLFPWVTIGLRAGDFAGPRIGPGVHVGTGAKVIGPVAIGAGAVVGANSVVTADVAPGTTVVGQPARPVRRERVAN